MSRIGKLPISIPENVEINFQNSIINVKGKFGNLKQIIPDLLEIKQTENNLFLNVKQKTRANRALHGLYRTLVNNMVIGVSEQFQITLNLQGVGYRAIVQNQILTLNLGYSHPIDIKIPDEISVEIVQNTTIHLKSCNKENLGLFASNIRQWRPPEPYNGKGILYKDEIIKRKVGKSGKK